MGPRFLIVPSFSENMSGLSSREVIVDDSDSRIFYSSSFFVDNSGNKDHQGNFGPTLDSTLHGTNSTGSFQFQFSGESPQRLVGIILTSIVAPNRDENRRCWDYRSE